ncbi:MAG TPA: hypothetical protein VF604_17705 [Pyrinomonadaceae bacterium]
MSSSSSSNAKIWAQKRKEREKNLRGQQSGKAVEKRLHKPLFLIIVVFVLALPLAVFGFYAYQNFVQEAALEFAGNTIVVRAGGDLQAALDKSKPGDTILLQAGAAFRGNFNLPAKAGNEFVTIRTSVADPQLPPAETRLDPKRYGAVLPKISSPNNEPVINAEPAAHHYRFVGIEFGGTKDGIGNIIKIGSTDEKRLEDLPHHIEFDRVYIHGTSAQGQRRGIAANGRFLKITNSHISDIKRKGEESQAIAVWATDGNIEIVNNYLEAAAENILFGGAGSALGLIPSDCVVRHNWMNKPLNWREEGWDVKNLFEIKNGRRIRIENNLLTNNWGSAQDGTAIVIKSTTDSGAGATAADIVFINNIVRGSANALSVNGSEEKGGHQLTIRNNIFDDIDGAKWNGQGFFMKSADWDGLVIENNTIIQNGNAANAYGVVRGFLFRNNVLFEGEYGFKGDGTAPGRQTIDRFFPGGDVSFNAIIGGDGALYRGKNMYPSSLRQLGFVNFEARDFTLRPDSTLRGKGFQGKNIGADLDARTVGGK